VTSYADPQQRQPNLGGESAGVPDEQRGEPVAGPALGAGEPTGEPEDDQRAKFAEKYGEGQLDQPTVAVATRMGKSAARAKEEELGESAEGGHGPRSSRRVGLPNTHQLRGCASGPYRIRGVMTPGEVGCPLSVSFSS
jgi:hypothetical protein